jgi:putrescine transport system permease protein
MNRVLTAIFNRLTIGVPYLWLIIFFLLPFIIVFKISLSDYTQTKPPYSPVINSVSEWATKSSEFDIWNYKILYCDLKGQLGFGVKPGSVCDDPELESFVESPYLSKSYISSIITAFIATFLTLLIGYPLAYGMARAPSTLRPTLLMLVILPFWTSFLIRVYAWIGILKPEGLLNQLLLSLHIISTPLQIMNTFTAIYIGIVYSYLPFMVLPIYSALEKMDYSLIEAAQDLGCPPAKAFWNVTFPLSLPGVIAGCFLVFIPATGEFVIPDLLGGSSTLMIGKTLWNEFNSNRDWPVSSAVAVVLLLLLVIPIVLFQNAQAKAQEAGK